MAFCAHRDHSLTSSKGQTGSRRNQPPPGYLGKICFTSLVYGLRCHVRGMSALLTPFPTKSPRLTQPKSGQMEHSGSHEIRFDSEDTMTNGLNIVECWGTTSGLQTVGEAGVHGII